MENKQRKIIIFMNSYSQGMSGGDIRCIEMAKRLCDYKKVVITSLLGKESCEYHGLKAKYLVTSKESHFGNVIFTYIERIFKALLLKMKISKGDILYSSSDFFPDVFPAFVFKLRNKEVKWVALLHLLAPAPFYGYEQWYLKQKKIKLPTVSSIFYKITQLLSIRLMKWEADTILVPNFEIKKYLIKKGINKNKILVIVNGINYYEIQKIGSVKKDSYDGCFVGRFHSQKGIFDLIKIWELICSQKKNAKLAVVGSGSRKIESKIRMEIKKRKLEGNINLLGYLDKENKFRFLKSSKIFLFLSFYESWGIVVAEAVACGLPVVAWDLPIYADVYENNILRVPIGDINQFAETVIKLLDNEKLRSDLGLKGQKFIQKYDWDKVAEKEYKILQGIL